MKEQAKSGLALAIAVLCLGGGSHAAPVAQKSKSKAPPTVSLRSSNDAPAAGTRIQLTWSSFNASSCRASGAWTGTKKSSGSEFVTPSNGVYTLTCSGSGGSASASVPIVVRNGQKIPGGIWLGTDSLTKSKVTGIATEDGTVVFLLEDGRQYYGKFDVSPPVDPPSDIADMLSKILYAPLDGGMPIGLAFADGSTYGAGSINSSYSPRLSINAGINFMTAAGTSLPEANVNFTFSKMYYNGSSLADIAGNYTSAADKSVVNINSNGTVFSQSPSTGCVVNGLVKIISATYNAYDISYSFSSCTGQFAFLNGTTAVGLGMMDRTTEPRVLRVGLHSDAAHYVISGAYPRK